MSNALKAVAGIVLLVVGTYTASFGGFILRNAGISLLLSAAVGAIGPKPPRASPLSGNNSINYSGTLEPRRIIYGTLKVGGMNVVPPMTSGPSHDLADVALAFSARA